MATKSVQKSRSKLRSRKNVRRDRPVTPAERLRATVLVIRDSAKTRPNNSMIGRTPSETIARCARVIHWLQTSSKESVGIVIANADVLRTVYTALDHAAAEADQLWHAAARAADVFDVLDDRSVVANG
jgi:hypothetical protein